MPGMTLPLKVTNNAGWIKFIYLNVSMSWQVSKEYTEAKK